MISRLAVRWFLAAQGCRSVHQRRDEGREAGWSGGEGYWFYPPALLLPLMRGRKQNSHG